MTVSTGREEDLRRSNSMSLTYSDFYYNHEPDEDLNLGALPREFQVIQDTQVPLLQTVEKCDQDFVIIAEFSEHIGPSVLTTIPVNTSDKTDLKLDDLAVHLMSTDYQVNLVGHFKICEDTQVLRKNVFQDIHVFMHYFTLYDIKARGFVRPFCFGYVTKDHVKLDKKLESLIHEFDKMARVLKFSNRKWFSGELEQYLEKLSKAKDSFIQDLTPKRPSVDHDTDSEELFAFDLESEDSIEDPEAITLDQIAHQFSEIENILRTVKALESSLFDAELQELSSCLTQLPNNSGLLQALQKMQVVYVPNEKQHSIESLNIPLVHPLKVKGESLRPLTTLGQLGTINLVSRLYTLYNKYQVDMLFTEMKELTNDFRHHCEQNRASSLQNLDPSCSSENFVPESSTSTVPSLSPRPHSSLSSSSRESFISAVNSPALLSNPEIALILELIHSNTPVVSDNKSGSYHTVSEEESESNIPCSFRNGTGTDSNGYLSAIGSVESIVPKNGLNFNLESPPRNKSPNFSGKSPSSSISQNTSTHQSTSSLSQTMSSASVSPSTCPVLPSANQDNKGDELIDKTPWWVYASKKLVRGQPGYGILNFFIRYKKVAHHILYSILLGRPIILFGKEDQRSKVGNLISALIPLIPSYPSKTWKLLRWHRGILVAGHLKDYKLIGLCIPERLDVYDLIHQRDIGNYTIFNVPKKTILGPAYSGQLLSGFEPLCKKTLSNSDVSILSYYGRVVTDIETKIYMFKCLEETNRKDKKRIDFKDMDLRASDIDMIRYLAGLICDPDSAVDIFS